MTLVAVAVGTFVFCALVYGGWHWYERRHWRGAHTRTDENYSVSEFIAQTVRRWAEEDAAKAGGGSHHLRDCDEMPVRLLSGEELLSGYYQRRSALPPRSGHATVAGQGHLRTVTTAR